MANTDYIEVTIKEAAHEDAGRGIARRSIDAMKALDLVSGDVVEIAGRQKAATLVWPGFPQDTGKAILRIDAARSNVGSGIDDKVQIRKTEAGYAKSDHPADPAHPPGRRGTAPGKSPPRPSGHRRAAHPGKHPWKPAHVRHHTGGPEGYRHRHRQHRDRAERDPVRTREGAARQRPTSTMRISAASTANLHRP